MMMNFLDLSAASDEERRLISEILSDTSVVNFAEPLRQRQKQEFVRDQTDKLSANQNDTTRQQLSQHYYQYHHQPNNQLARNKTPQSHYQSAHHQQQQQIQQNHTTINPTNSANHDQRLNNVHNHNTPVSTDNHRHMNHVQMPSPMAGDISPNIVGMDMAAAQHAGYPIPHPSTAHVQPAYGPPPPHMFNGAPIFQHYPIIVPYHNLVYSNMSPYSVLPASNSVVAPRQVPPQTSQPPNANVATNSHSRSQTHHPRQMKTKEQSGKQSLPNQGPIIDNSITHQNQFNNKQNHDATANAINTTSDHSNSHELVDEYGSNSDDRLHDNLAAPSHLDGTLNHVDNTTVLDDRVNQAAEQVQERYNTKPTNSNKTNVSSGKKLEEQTSSKDPSKQHQESSKVLPHEKLKEDEINSKREASQVDDPEQSHQEEKTNNHDCDGDRANKPGPWSSAASKSWASLFKGDGPAPHGVTLNGGSDNTSSSLNTSEDEFKKDMHKNLGPADRNGVQAPKGSATKSIRSQDAARRALDRMAPKLAHKINSITLKHSLPLLRPRGFINKGNGCYINSTLQALIACPPFYNLMKEIGDLKDLRRDNSCTPILDNFAELFLNFPPLDASKKNKQNSSDQKMQISQLQAEALEPKCIYEVLGHIKSECLKGAQEDAEEFLSSVLNGLHEEMIGLSETLQSIQTISTSNQNGHQSDTDDMNGDPNNDDNVWREVGPKNRSLPIRTATVVNTPIQEIFGGSLFSIRTAGKDRCGHRSPFFDLQLDISGDNVKSLQDAIKSFTATEIIHDFYCSKTRQTLDAHRRTSLDQLPPILILHLKQFIYTQDHGLKKLMKRIEYPIDFELPESCLHDKNPDKSLRNSRTYKLLAVVYHEGREAVKGHYLTDVYHIGSNQWIRCDDSNLKVVSAPRIDDPDSSRTPYLLFYRRHNTLKPPQSSNNNYNSHHDINKKKS